MTESVFMDPELTIALALCFGLVGNVLAHHLKIPAIVLLLAAGVLLGPDGAGIIHPEALGHSLNSLTGFAVAVILFEGGLNQEIPRLKRIHRTVWMLILSGGIFSVAGGLAAAHFLLGWPWWAAFLFGSLAMVTGPTVINPLLRRLKVRQSTAAVLEAEGVLVDAVGGVVATVALYAVLSSAEASPLAFGWHVVSRLGFGALCGTAMAFALVALFLRRGLIPEGIENVFALSAVLILFQGCNMVLDESGLAAVVAAGIIVGSKRTYALQDLAEFKEELTTLLIGMLFVLLAADVRLSQVMDLGFPGLAVVLVMMFLIRPAAVLTGSLGSRLNFRERLFIAWIGPRGIVAAAVASFFAVSLEANGLPFGYQLRALVFLLIAMSVLSAGLTGGVVANRLGLRRPSRNGWVILGAGPASRALSRLLKEDGQETVLIDANADRCEAAERDCTRVLFGKGLSSSVLKRAQIDTRRGAIALTPDDEMNFLFVRQVKKEIKEITLFSALSPDSESLTPEKFHEAGAQLAFGHAVDIKMWEGAFNEKEVHLHFWRRKGGATGNKDDEGVLPGYSGNGLLAVAVEREEMLEPVGDETRFKAADEVWFFVLDREWKEAEDFLIRSGWEKISWEDKDTFSLSVCHLDGKICP
ncbi:MAG: cation:proton antiporter [Proteobacteria bacterium]|nr:cation:proton antiporter [Pseudomonadota bacterium]